MSLVLGGKGLLKHTLSVQRPKVNHLLICLSTEKCSWSALLTGCITMSGLWSLIVIKDQEVFRETEPSLSFKSLSAFWFVVRTPLLCLNSNLYKEEIPYDELYTGVLFSSPLAHLRRLRSFLWWTPLYKMARLENQRGEDTGGDYAINKYFPCLALLVINRIPRLHGILFYICFSYDYWIALVHRVTGWLNFCSYLLQSVSRNTQVPPALQRKITVLKCGSFPY